MAKYRLYKNGIYGIRYKKYFIQKNDDKGFSIYDKDAKPIEVEFDNAEDCQWHIDKLTATKEEMDMIKSLYEKEIFDLSAAFVRLMEKNNKVGLTPDETVIYEYIAKIRKRKAEEKNF